MSLLNQLFNRGLLGPKCKTCLSLAISRMKLLQNKRDMQLKNMRKEIAQFLHSGQEPIARIRVEHIIREQNTCEAYEILEMFCEFVLARVPILESQRDCPQELRESVASIIFAAPRCADLPDLLHVRNLFAAKYGKEFVAAASELRPDTSVNRTIIEKLSVSAPSAETRLKILKEIAREYNVNWDSSKTEAEFSKKAEDLLNGPKPLSQAPPKQDQLKSLPSDVTNRDVSTTTPSKYGGVQFSSSPGPANNNMPLLSPEASSKQHRNNAPPQSEWRSQSSSDALVRARAAIAAADRATAAARAAAALVNAANYNHPQNLQAKS